VKQIHLGGSPISFQDKASGGLQRCAEEECHAKHDNPRSKYAKAYLNYLGDRFCKKGLKNDKI
ncbi:MAG: hypothetical protein MRZ65_02765, partial [Lachnospiraceae bacterium]|nr:hypothetical protein [Lachnospiraceae bacterium]